MRQLAWSITRQMLGNSNLKRSCTMQAKMKFMKQAHRRSFNPSLRVITERSSAMVKLAPVRLTQWPEVRLSSSTEESYQEPLIKSLIWPALNLNKPSRSVSVTPKSIMIRSEICSQRPTQEWVLNNWWQEIRTYRSLMTQEVEFLSKVWVNMSVTQRKTLSTACSKENWIALSDSITSMQLLQERTASSHFTLRADPE